MTAVCLIAAACLALLNWSLQGVAFSNWFLHVELLADDLYHLPPAIHHCRATGLPPWGSLHTPSRKVRGLEVWIYTEVLGRKSEGLQLWIYTEVPLQPFRGESPGAVRGIGADTGELSGAFRRHVWDSPAAGKCIPLGHGGSTLAEWR